MDLGKPPLVKGNAISRDEHFGILGAVSRELYGARGGIVNHKRNTKVWLRGKGAGRVRSIVEWCECQSTVSIQGVTTSPLPLGRTSTVKVLYR